jgi:hypothetical protein
MEVHSPTGAASPNALSPKGQKMVFNIDTASQKNMLFNAVNKDATGMETDQEGYEQYLEHTSPKTIIQNIPI